MIALDLDGRHLVVREQRGPFVRVLCAYDEDGHVVAHISWNEYTGQIWGLGVNDAKDAKGRWIYRRHGIATILYLLARDIEPRLHHSAMRTDDGENWARSLGEPLPERIAA